MAVIFMTGAPAAADLNWNENQLSPYFVARLRRYLQVDTQDETTQDSLATATHPLAKWRDVLPKAQGSRQRQSAPAPHAKPRETAQFLSFQAEPASQEHMMFLEHSLAVLQSLQSSQINAPEDTTDEGSVYDPALASFSTSLSTNFSQQRSYVSSYAAESSEQQIVNFSGAITDLKRMPDAHYLQLIYPQTMTVNILASVISIQSPRTVKLRKRPGEMDIIEILFGDETRAGFSISFWFPPADSQQTRRSSSSSRNDLRELLNSIRTGDILLVTHVALGEFNNNVYGQSLSRRITRNNTSVIVLSENVTGLSSQSTAKLERLREWSANFVGKKTRSTGLSETTDEHHGSGRPMLPPDTQPETTAWLNPSSASG